MNFSLHVLLTSFPKKSWKIWYENQGYFLSTKAPTLQIYPTSTDSEEVEVGESGVVGNGSFCQDAGWSYAIGKFQVGCLKFGEVSLELKLNHPGSPIEVGLEWLALGYLMEKVVKVCQDKRPRGNIIERMQYLHQRDPL